MVACRRYWSKTRGNRVAELTANVVDGFCVPGASVVKTDWIPGAPNVGAVNGLRRVYRPVSPMRGR
jgi:hypothetical protein